MSGEIAGSRFGAIGAHRHEPRAVGGELAGGDGVVRRIPQSDKRIDECRIAQLEKHPAAFLAPLDQVGVGEDLEVATDPRLALRKDLRKLADRQLHLPQQCHEAQPGRIGQRLEEVGQRKRDGHHITI